MKPALSGAGPFALVFAVSLAWMLGVFVVFHRGASTMEFAHYAEIGRNIAKGDGFSTRVLYPSALAYFSRDGRAGAEPLPVIHRFPLPSYANAASQILLGENDFAAAAGLLLAYALWAALVFEAIRRWKGPLEGVIAAALLLLCPTGSKYFALFGLPDVYFGCAAFALHALLAQAGPAMPVRSAIACGVLAGVAWLARYNLWLWLPLYIGYIAGTKPLEKGRAAAVAAFLAAFFAVTAPMMAYNLRHFGTIMTPDMIWNLSHGTLVQEQGWLNFRFYDLREVTALGIAPFIRKAWNSFHLLLMGLPTLWQSQLLFPWLALGLVGHMRGPSRRFALLTGAALLVQVPVFCVLRFDSWGGGVGYRYIFWAFPLLAYAAACGLAELLRARGAAPRLLAAGWFTLHAALLAPFFTRDLTSIHLSHPSGVTPRDWPEISLLRRITADGSAVISNLPAHVGWYAGGAAASLPNDPEDVPRMAGARPFRYLFISFINIGTLGDFPRWLELLRPSPKGLKEYCVRHGYAPVATFPAGVIIDLLPRRGTAANSHADAEPQVP